LLSRHNPIPQAVKNPLVKTREKREKARKAAPSNNFLASEFSLWDALLGEYTTIPKVVQQK